MKRILILACTLTLLLGACSSASGETTTKPSGTSSRTEQPEASNGSRAEVAITATGFEPHWAIVAVDGRVTFTNRTTGSQQIVFDNARDAAGAALQSPSIAPGATWVWTADTFASFAYHSPQLPGVDGRIQVDPPVEP